jgi:O-antigen ligase
MWKMAWNGFLDSPLVGKGYGWLLSVVVGSDVQELPASIIHNSLLHILACGGLIGFLPLVAVIVVYFRLCLKEMRRGLGQRKRLIAACAMGIAINFFFAASANVILETVSIALVGWLLLAVALRLAQAGEPELDEMFGSAPPVRLSLRPRPRLPR